jgi:hypothetical protein
MKTKITAALSLTGVLVAGSAAALVNTQVLQNNSEGSTTVPVFAPPAALLATTTTVAGAVVPTTVLDGSTSSTSMPSMPDSSSTVPTTATTPVSTAPAAGAVPTQAVYRIGDAGTVTLDTKGDRLTVVATAPSAGWQVGKVEQRSPLDIEIHFRSATVELEFKANLLFGVVSTSVESRTLGAPPAGATTVPAPGTSVHDNDNDDDSGQHSDDGDHADDEHEDDDD